MSTLPVQHIAPHASERYAPRNANARGFHSAAEQRMLYSTPRNTAEPLLQLHSFDAAYVEGLRSGDQATQEHFVQYFSDLLRIKLRSRLRSTHAVEDVKQETFLRVLAVLRKDGGLRQPERLGAFVNTVCNHVLFEYYRSSGRSESLDAEGQPELPASGASALDLAAQRQLSKKVHEILVDLPVRDRNILKAVFIEEEDRDDVCQQFGVDREYLRVLLHRAKQEFRGEYERRMGGRIRPDMGRNI